MLDLSQNAMQIMVFCCQSLILCMAVDRALAIDGGEGDWWVEWGVESVEVVEEMGDFKLEGWELNEGEFFFLGVQVIYDLQVDLLQDNIQLVQDFLLHLIEDVFAYLHHNCQIIYNQIHIHV